LAAVYVLGAGFSRTCGIATDAEMLDALNPLLPRAATKRATFPTSIEAVKDQNFPEGKPVGFELFMSTIAALKFTPEFLNVRPNIFRQAEREIRQALKRYLKDKVAAVEWDADGETILDFVRSVNWKSDTIITFNYDLLLEAGLDKLGVSGKDRVMHLHGSLEDRTLVYPTYRKLAYRTTRTRVAARWNDAYRVLRSLGGSDRLIFVGYSMPPTDLEAKGLFNYTDWYNAYERNPTYTYPIVVVDRNPAVICNYSFVRRPPKLHPMRFAEWFKLGMPI